MILDITRSAINAVVMVMLRAMTGKIGAKSTSVMSVMGVDS